MTMYDIICRKRDGGELSKSEIDYFIEGYTSGSIPDYQASALLMAIYLKGMSKEETFLLTDAMKRSGDEADLSNIEGIKVDKHSTGGVGDKTTLIAAPLAAACGIPVAKMSGRGLGFTGGTVDKLEAIPGFRIALEEAEFHELVNGNGIAVIGQTAHIAAADKKLYALRDVTATVDNISLITSSIMSKKLASGSDAILLDVKCGNGAFMQTLEEASELGRWMVDIGRAAEKKTVAMVTDMSQPLGNAVGNSLEVIEAIETLKGNGPADITELSLQLSAYMVYLGDRAETPEEGLLMVRKALEDGSGLKKLELLIGGQGGDTSVLQDYSLLPQAVCKSEVKAEREGFVIGIAAREIGLASQRSGAGRERKEDEIDLAAGILLHKKIGDFVRQGEVLADVYGTDDEKTAEASRIAAGAYSIGPDKPRPEKLIKEVIVSRI